MDLPVAPSLSKVPKCLWAQPWVPRAPRTLGKTREERVGLEVTKAMPPLVVVVAAAVVVVVA